MTEQESIAERLARIEEHLVSIDRTLAAQLVCRHVTKEGECDFFEAMDKTVTDHDRRINQWTGALTAVAMICSMIGALIGAILTRIWR